MDHTETLGTPDMPDSSTLQTSTATRRRATETAEGQRRGFYRTGLLAFFSPFEAAVDAADEGDRRAAARSSR